MEYIFKIIDRQLYEHNQSVYYYDICEEFDTSPSTAKKILKAYGHTRPDIKVHFLLHKWNEDNVYQMHITDTDEVICGAVADTEVYSVSKVGEEQDKLFPHVNWQRECRRAEQRCANALPPRQMMLETENLKIFNIGIQNQSTAESSKSTIQPLTPAVSSKSSYKSSVTPTLPSESPYVSTVSPLIPTESSIEEKIYNSSNKDNKPDNKRRKVGETGVSMNGRVGLKTSSGFNKEEGSQRSITSFFKKTRK